jgi:hypothetical protein
VSKWRWQVHRGPSILSCRAAEVASLDQQLVVGVK